MKTKKDLKEIVLCTEWNKETYIFYKWKDKDYGRTEFTICPIWKRGRLCKLYIYPQQQRDIDYFYSVEVSNCESINPIAWTHRGMENPWVWMYLWCKDHKCMSLRLYVPPNSSKLTIRQLSGCQLVFE